MSKIINSLNPKQQLAVLYNDGPLAIIAGAGSGKTRTITHKIAYLIKEKGIDPYKILAVTFTNKAANEMKERVIDLVGDIGKKVMICTYHSFCARVLRSDIDHLGYSKNFNIIDTVDQRQILRLAYKKYGLSSRSIPYSRVINMISRFKNSRISPKEAHNDAIKDIDVAYANLYSYYLEQTKNSNNLDFDDLLLVTEELFHRQKEVAKKWSSRYNYVLVDEFQDTSRTQYNIIKIVSQKAIFTAVGDPDQNIYSWRYADSRLIASFNQRSVDARTILLEQNYRSTQKILNAANKLISNNKNRIKKNLFTTNEEGEHIKYYHGFSEDSEARWVVNRIQDLINNGHKQKDIAILYRSNFLTNPLEKALITANINYVIYGAIKFYQREEIKDVVAYLKIINNGDTVSLKRVINIPVRSIGSITQEKIFNQLSKYKESLFRSIIDHFDEIDIKTKPKQELAKFINLVLKYQKALKTNKIKDVIKKFLFEINYERKWSSLEERGRLDNINELINNIEVWEKENKELTLTDFLNEVSLYIDYENKTTKPKNAISLMTVHTSKGLEFKNTFIFGMSENIFPSRKTIDDQDYNGMEEERRLAYVAVTRAKERLYISSSRGFSLDHTVQKTPSRFVQELGIEPKAHSKHFVFEKTYTQKRINNNFLEGEKILHDKFGGGIVLSIEGDIMQVAFKSPYGIKSILKNHHSVRKADE